MNIYCSQLGMIVEFYYCISMHEGLPCLSTPRCWANRMDIEGYLKGLMGEEGFFNYFASLPKTRLERIVELVNNLVEKD
ncbi:MAG TPA: hypothetical protein PLX88_06025 [Syntrophorhabdaceae bacterium]|jgi:hypothetical protein|nr:hypothetical protein [Syntrophorhabdaceae bacterium]MDI9562423.1 hypothetical protein [Pseudomonadota bacterium]OQC51416.1 MAG: hypothetical protein BWX58_00281 [Deltaproteobacteria bacterium ADurb.Bin026]MBP8697596.1 hypothetical protein [Syntrophorhabdaceae bacterium]MBV6506870.1 hypothetical protein [Syntrophorhabdaceae bacterium]